MRWQCQCRATPFSDPRARAYPLTYLKDLAGKFQSGELTDQKLRSSSTEEVMASLLKVKGLG